MGRPRITHTVTEDDVDWSFMQDKGFVNALAARSRRIAAQRGLDADDLFQEVLIYVAAHPTWANRASKKAVYAVLDVAEYLTREKEQNAHEQVDHVPHLAVGITGA